MADRGETRRLTGVIADKIADGSLFNQGIYSRKALSDVVRAAAEDMSSLDALTQVHHRDDWQERDGAVLWWRLPVGSPPYCGTPEDAAFPGWATHWTRLPTPRL